MNDYENSPSTSDQTGSMHPTQTGYESADSVVNTAGYTPYRRQVSHITQEPIDDVEPQYVTRQHYVTLEESRNKKRKHMGTAVDDPEYLPQGPSAGGGALAPDGRRTITHSARYLQTPKAGKSIFTSQKERARKRKQHMVLALVVLAVIAIAVVLFVIL